MRNKSKKRIELGEDGWKEHQKERDKAKSRKYYNKNVSHTSRWRIRLKKKLIEYKGGKCERCDYDKDVPRAYHFHHRNPEEKEFVISKYGHGLEALKKEADKCDLLCANCHAEAHDKEYAHDRIEYEKAMRPTGYLVPIDCLQCCKNFKPVYKKQMYCSIECSSLAQRKAKNRPNEQQLKQIIENTSWVAIGKRYGVSDSTVRKWAHKYKLI